MAHELEFKDGKASFFSVAETAWHKEGMVLDKAPSFAEAIELANLNYDVEKRPTAYQCFTPDGDSYMKSSASAFVTVRTDTQQELGAVGKDYQPLQNLEAFRVLEPLIDSGLATIETGGVLRDGADAWMLTRWNLDKFGPVVREIFGNEVVPFGLLANNHNGRRGIVLQDTNVRVVCANTLGFAEGETTHRIVVKHGKDARSNVVDAATKLWGGLIERYEVLALQYKALKAITLREEQFTAAVLDLIAPDPRHAASFNPEAKLAEMVVERAERKRTVIRALWENGKGHTGDHSGWEAYNAAVEAIDHNTDLFPTRAGTYRTASLLDGSLAIKKRNVLAACVELAGQAA